MNENRTFLGKGWSFSAPSDLQSDVYEYQDFQSYKKN